ATGVQVEVTGGEFGELANPTTDGQLWDRVAPQILEHRAGEVPHVQQRVFGQPVQLGDHAFRCAARAPGNVLPSGGAGNVNATADARDPCRARVRHDNPCSAQYGQTTKDTQTRVPCLASDLRSVRNGHIEYDSTSRVMRRGDLAHDAAHQLPRNGVDRRFTHVQRQPGFSDRADAGSSAKGHSGPQVAG